MDATQMKPRRTMATSFVNWGSYEWAGVDRQRAVEMFGEQIAYAVMLNEETITLPPHAAKVLYACAKAGARKGRGRGNAMTDRRRAVGRLGQVIANEGWSTLSRQEARLVLACAKDGQHKGQGRGRPRNTRRDQLAKRSSVQVARQKKVELVAATENMRATGANSAEEKAAEDAHKWLSDRGLRLKVDTIIRRMQ
jgi:hypothetical protein